MRLCLTDYQGCKSRRISVWLKSQRYDYICLFYWQIINKDFYFLSHRVVSPKFFLNLNIFSFLSHHIFIHPSTRKRCYDFLKETKKLREKDSRSFLAFFQFQQFLLHVVRLGVIDIDFLSAWKVPELHKDCTFYRSFA